MYAFKLASVCSASAHNLSFVDEIQTHVSVGELLRMRHRATLSSTFSTPSTPSTLSITTVRDAESTLWWAPQVSTALFSKHSHEYFISFHYYTIPLG